MKKIRNLVSGWVSMKETVQDPVAITLFMSEVDAYKMGNALEALKDYVVLVENQQTQALLEKLIEAFPKPPKEETYDTEPKEDIMPVFCSCYALPDIRDNEYYEPCPEHPGRFKWVSSLKAHSTPSPAIRTGEYFRDQAKAEKMVRYEDTLRWDTYNPDELQKLCEETHPGFLKANDDSNKMASKMQGSPNISPGSTVDPISVIREAFFEVARKLGHDRCGNQRKE
jgi:hypothetical protein